MNKIYICSSSNIAGYYDFSPKVIFSSYKDAENWMIEHYGKYPTCDMLQIREWNVCNNIEDSKNKENFCMPIKIHVNDGAGWNE